MGALLTAGQAFCALPMLYTQRPGGRWRLCLHKLESSALQPHGSSLLAFKAQILDVNWSGDLDSGGQPYEKQETSLAD